jgi:hypothetical protein
MWLCALSIPFSVMAERPSLEPALSNAAAEDSCRSDPETTAGSAAELPDEMQMDVGTVSASRNNSESSESADAGAIRSAYSEGDTADLHNADAGQNSTLERTASTVESADPMQTDGDVAISPGSECRSLIEISEKTGVANSVQGDPKPPNAAGRQDSLLSTSVRNFEPPRAENLQLANASSGLHAEGITDACTPLVDDPHLRQASSDDGRAPLGKSRAAHKRVNWVDEKHLGPLAATEDGSPYVERGLGLTAGGQHWVKKRVRRLSVEGVNGARSKHRSRGHRSWPARRIKGFGGFEELGLQRAHKKRASEVGGEADALLEQEAIVRSVREMRATITGSKITPGEASESGTASAEAAAKNGVAGSSGDSRIGASVKRGIGRNEPSKSAGMSPGTIGSVAIQDAEVEIRAPTPAMVGHQGWSPVNSQAQEGRNGGHVDMGEGRRGESLFRMPPSSNAAMAFSTGSAKTSTPVPAAARRGSFAGMNGYSGGAFAAIELNRGSGKAGRLSSVGGEDIVLEKRASAPVQRWQLMGGGERLSREKDPLFGGLQPDHKCEPAQRCLFTECPDLLHFVEVYMGSL